ncbi:Lrp/AsnC family transcriptional regulator [Nocardia sp. NPDC004123]
MTRVDVEPLDELDRALLARLRVDGRETNRSLANALGINEITVAARIRRLEECDVMRVVAVTDMRVFGHREFAFAALNVSERPALQIAADVAALPESISVTITTGRHDLIVPILGRDRTHLAELLGVTLASIPGVDQVRGYPVLDVLRFDSDWGLLSVDPGTVPTARPSDTADELDLAIIDNLQVDARRSNRSIAAELDISEGTVRSRIKRLLADNVIRIQAVSDISQFGIGAYAFVGITVRDGRFDEAAGALLARADLPQLSRTLGEFDFIATAFAPTRAALLSALLNEIALLPGIRRIETFEAFTTTKHTYLWSWVV